MNENAKKKTDIIRIANIKHTPVTTYAPLHGKTIPHKDEIGAFGFSIAIDFSTQKKLCWLENIINILKGTALHAICS